MSAAFPPAGSHPDGPQALSLRRRLYLWLLDPHTPGNLHQSIDRFIAGLIIANLFALLFEVTGLFDMRTRPELLLLQKTMVVVEGVARTLNPNLNMWVTAEPVVRGWIERKLGPIGKLEEASGSLGGLFTGLPMMLEDAKRATTMLSDMAANATGHRKTDHLKIMALAEAAAEFARPFDTAWIDLTKGLGCPVGAVLAGSRELMTPWLPPPPERPPEPRP